MTTVLWLLLGQAALGTFDTLYFHEWRGRLPARPEVAAELRLHAARTVPYVVLLATLPWVAWSGWLAVVLGAILLSEVVITLADFVVEDTVRKPQGGVFAGERATHAVIGIVYGAMLGYLAPAIYRWWQAPTGFVTVHIGVPVALKVTLSLLAVAVGASGVRDLLASTGMPAARWPWKLVQP